ncbi:MAG: UvrD-helicase domain-containing protein [Bacteroidales bacterium]|nr:UvrD-helicase domain-containing protein [Bacteroidales bacterium]
MSDKKLLSIYSASAGSGKTYILALNFIKLLTDDPKNYEHILAVTFTNKATAEMKERIISFLSTLASDPQNAAEEVKKRRLIDSLRRHGVAKTDSEISKACGQALLYILNDYSRFNISTIDSFVQRVVRAFAFEAHLPSSLGIELDQDVLVDTATDVMMALLRTDERLRKRMEDAVEKKISENQNWNSVEKQLKSLAKELFKNVGNEGLSIDYDTLNRKRNEIIAIKQNIVNETFDRFKPIADVFARESIQIEPEKFEDKSNNRLYKLLAEFVKIEPNNKRQKEDFYTFITVKGLKLSEKKTFKDKSGCEYLESEINGLFLDFYNYFGTTLIKYNTANLVLKNFDSVALLAYLDKSIKEISKTENKYPLCDFNRLLSKLIDNSSVPFVYEKIGTRIFNMMIDEFQDTSIEQWTNFKPLVKECLDRGNENLIVGDVKQAIYRWRGSDWQLLNRSLPTDNALQQYVKTVNLDKNWRSLPNIVNFNNLFFSEICKHISASYTSAFALDGSIFGQIFENVAQQPQRDTNSTDASQKGYVRLKVIADKRNVDDVRAEIAVEVVEQIEILRAKGFEYSDICILLRWKSDAASLLPALIEAGIPIVSSDALMVFNSMAVKTLEAYMKLLASPSDKHSLSQVIASLHTDGELFNWEEEKSLVISRIQKLKGLGLIELTFKLIELLPEELYNSQYIYIEAFTDMVQRFTDNRHASLSDLLDYFDQVRGVLAISSPENQNAVSVLTVHKSKGLEFRVVLVPDASWEVMPDSTKNIYVWADAQHPMPEQFMVTTPMPLKYEKSVFDTYARDIAIEEATSTMVDNLNVLYVAFTRAKEVLMAWASYKPSENKSGNDDVIPLNQKTPISSFINKTISNIKRLNDNKLEIEAAEGENFVTYSVGVLPDCAVSEKEADGVSTFQIEPCRVYPWSERIDIHRESEKDRFEARHAIINYGNIMHGIMEQIKTVSDVEMAVDKAVAGGDINVAKAAELKAELTAKLSGDKVARWFDGTMKTVYTEDVIAAADVEKRPDRIMLDDAGNAIVVDYKFGNLKQDKHAAQVRDYMGLLQRAGFSAPVGYLWYYSVGEVVEVRV